MEQNKEDILKSKWNPRYAIPMPFGYEAIYEAMEEYAEQWKLKYDELKAENERLNDQNGKVHEKNRKLSTEHAALKAKAQHLVDVLKSIEHAPVPANEREYISWFITAKNVAGGAVSEWDAAKALQDWQNKDGVNGV